MARQPLHAAERLANQDFVCMLSDAGDARLKAYKVSRPLLKPGR